MIATFAPQRQTHKPQNKMDTPTQIPKTEKKAKVTIASFKNQWTGKFGLMFDHTIAFDNGDKGVYQSKKKEQDDFVIGAEVNYTIESRLSRSGITDMVIKPERVVSNMRGGGDGFRKSFEKNYKADFISFSASYAKDLIVAGKAEIKDFRKVFQAMYSVMLDKLNEVNGESAKTTPEKSDKK